MAGFKLFPRSRQVTRKRNLRIVRDPPSPLKNAERMGRPPAGSSKPPTRLARLLRRLFR
jgi:hypothetical protein